MDSRRMCPHCRAFITTKDRTCPYCNEQVGPPASQRSSGDAGGGFIPQARFNTVVILIINFGLFVATVLASMRAGNSDAVMGLDNRTLLDFGAMFGPALSAGQWWRLVTAGFLHGGLLHILMNSWVLFDLGAQVDEVYGSYRMLVIYFVSNVTGFYLSYQIGHSLSVGASAALFGLVGAMVALGVRHRSGFGQAIRAVYIRYLVYLLLFSLLPGVDMAAHIGGLIGGFAIGYLAGEPRRTGPAEQAWKVAAWVCILVTAFCFLKMYLWFSQPA